MSKLVFVLMVVSLATALGGDEVDKKAATSEPSATPMMVSFTELKWTELPERKGMQFAVLSGDPKSGEYTQIRKVAAGTDNPLHSHSSEIKNVIISGVWYTGDRCRVGEGLRSGIGRGDAWGLGARQWLSLRKRVRVLPGGKREV